MSVRGLTLAGAVVLLALPALGWAQGLGDVAAAARKEREQRAGADRQPVRSFTNDDLPEREDSPESADSTTAQEPRPSREGSSADRPSGTARQRAEELDRARTRVERLEAKVEELQQRLNPMSTTYIYGGTGGPAGGGQSDQEIAVRRQLQATEQQLEEARDRLANVEGAGGGGSSRPEPRGETPY